MAGITAGHTFVAGERVSPTSLNELVSKAALTNVSNSDLQSGFALVNTVTQGSPITGSVRVSSTGKFEVYYGGAWNAIPDDPLTVTLTNGSVLLQTVPQYGVVHPLPGDPTKFTDVSGVGSFPGTNPLGVVQSSVTFGNTVSVVVRGVTNVRVSGTWSAGDLIRYDASIGYSTRAVTTGTGLCDTFGIMLASGGSPGVVTAGSAFIWK